MEERGFVVPELILVLTLVGVLLVIATPHYRRARDQWATDGAAAVVVRGAADARHLAHQQAQRISLHLDSIRGRVTLARGSDTLSVHDLQESFGVTLHTTRDSIAWSGNGLGFGAANTRVIVRRGVAAETVAVSRLGRVRR